MPCRSLFALLFLLSASSPLSAATFVVDTVADEVDMSPGDALCQTATAACSLRAAVQEANALPGADVIEVPAGVFTFSLAGSGENLAAIGDLDVSEDLSIFGQGEAQTVLDAAHLDRYFDLRVGDLHALGSNVTLHLADLTVRSGQTPSGAGNDGGCLANPEGGRLKLQRVTVRDCLCRTRGCAIFNGGILNAVDISILDNGDPMPGSMSATGGGIANVGPNAQTSLLRCEIRGQQAQNGGAIYTSAEFTTPQTSHVKIERCSLIDNQVQQLGGGIFLNSLSLVELLDSTVAGNSAGSGGGLFNDGGGHFEIHNSTIRENHASGIGGGISEVHFDPQFILLSNTILAGNTSVSSGPDCNLRLRSEGGSVIGNTSGCLPTTVANDQLNVDPQLAPLTQQAPRAWAYLPQEGSPIVDTGVGALCTAADQLGDPRPADGNGDGTSRCDIGAIEVPVALFTSGFESGGTSEWSVVFP